MMSGSLQDVPCLVESHFRLVWAIRVCVNNCWSSALLLCVWCSYCRICPSVYFATFIVAALLFLCGVAAIVLLLLFDFIPITNQVVVCIRCLKMMARTPDMSSAGGPLWSYLTCAYSYMLFVFVICKLYTFCYGWVVRACDHAKLS